MTSILTAVNNITMTIITVIGTTTAEDIKLIFLGSSTQIFNT